jgi:hypothetical protein
MSPGGPARNRRAVVRKRDGRCVECGLTSAKRKARTGRQLDVHRVVPGSLYTPAGCVTLCRRCHQSKPKLGPGEQDHGGAYATVKLARGAYAALQALADSTRCTLTWHLTRAVRAYLRQHELACRAPLGPAPKRPKGK